MYTACKYIKCEDSLLLEITFLKPGSFPWSVIRGNVPDSNVCSHRSLYTILLRTDVPCDWHK